MIFIGPRLVEERVHVVARRVLRSGPIESNDMLLDAGMDSSNAVRFVGELRKEFEGVLVPSTLLEQHPSLADIASFLSRQLKLLANPELKFDPGSRSPRALAGTAVID